VEFAVSAPIIESLGSQGELRDTLDALARQVAEFANEALPIFSWKPSSPEPYRLIVTLEEQRRLGVPKWMLHYEVTRNGSRVDLQEKPSSRRIWGQAPTTLYQVFLDIRSVMAESLNSGGETQFEQDLQKGLLSRIPLDTVRVGDRFETRYDLMPFPGLVRSSFLRLMRLDAGQLFPVGLLRVGADYRASLSENGPGVVRFRDCVLKATAWRRPATYDWFDGEEPGAREEDEWDKVRGDLEGARLAVLTWGFYKKGPGATSCGA